MVDGSERSLGTRNQVYGTLTGQSGLRRGLAILVSVDSIPLLCSTCFAFMGLVSAAVDTEVCARLGSRTEMYFIGLALTVSR